MPAIEWLLVACATDARIFQRERGSPMVQVASFSHPEGRLRARELGDDRPGRERADRAFGGMAYAPRQDAHHREHLRFARELAEQLEHGAREHAYGSLLVLAGSPFLGEIHKAMGEHARRLLKASLPLNLCHLGQDEIERRVQREFASA